MLYQKIVKPVFFKMDPEKAHHVTMDGMRMANKIPGALSILNALYGVPEKEELSQRLWNIKFSNPVGLAAGLDKNAIAVQGFSSIGFGFMEVGTVTPKAQPGNEQPRLFRLPQDEALINRMGFNNEGADSMAHHLQKVYTKKVPIAVNIGKNKITPNEDAVRDYQACIKRLYTYGDFFVVNISSPNTPNLRELQHGDELNQLLQAVMDEMKAQHEKYGKDSKPVLVKIAPDLSDQELEMTIKSIVNHHISGVIATNTTVSREGLSHPHAKETGGLSGKNLLHPSTEIIRKIYKISEGKIPIIGSGGIFTAEDAYEKIRAGASLVEIYTSLIYKGPSVVREINAGLLNLLKRDGYKHISEAVGAEHK
ncbi:quinone-dependent dihydroorotate dehydrogenase [Chengkuizengella axinellae]|uniref:Dihydroorotate dehydrogenase (quinone) n=1 Tax=Chengkuizengella axinellae TaxID=3064388 RepID=A0ABT9J0M2_9BACL|nr:quinone-dependent dihydroorotate dehydrogenase [Chengkuizengella sp. 2205SS18-9]MDP5274559.1 quinone-dependent dihydroorotate dehydrogenase [Chengkuizengella sp. 2205SS18-9]